MMQLHKHMRAVWVAVVGVIIFWPWLFFFYLETRVATPAADVPTDGFDTVETAEALSAYTEEEFGYTLPTESSLLSASVFKCDLEPAEASQEEGSQYIVHCFSEEKDGINVTLGEMTTSMQHDEFLPKEIERIVERENGGLNTYSCTNDIAYTTLHNLPGGITDCEIALTDGSTIYASIYFFGFERTEEISHLLSVYADGSTGNTDVVRSSLRDTIPLIKGVEVADTATATTSINQ